MGGGGKHPHPHRGVFSVAFSPDTLASASWQEILWEVDTLANTHTLTGYTNWVFSVAFSPDGNTLASGSWYRGTVRLWMYHTGANTRTLTGHTGLVNSVAFSPDGNTLASAIDGAAVEGGHGGKHPHPHRAGEGLQ